MNRYLDDETWAQVRVTEVDQSYVTRLNSIEQTEASVPLGQSTSDFLVAGDIHQEESKQQTGRCYKIVRSMLLFLKTILDCV